MATIPQITFPDGSPVVYLAGDIDYLTTTDDVTDLDLNRPLHNLSDRDVRLRDKINEVIDAHNDAFTGTTFLVPNSDVGHTTPLGTMEEFLALEHNADGTHKGGSPHGPVVIDSTPELNLINIGGEQRLSMFVGSGANTVCAGGDSRLHTSDPTSPSNADHDGRYYTEAEVDALVDAAIAARVTFVPDDYLTPKAALDAGEDYIVVAPGTYDDRTAGAITVSKRVTLLGQGSSTDVIWQHDGLTLDADADGSVIHGIDFTTDDSTVTVAASDCRLSSITFSLIDSGYAAALTLSGTQNYVEQLAETGTNAVQALVSATGNGNVIRGVSLAAIGMTSSDYRVRVSGLFNSIHTVVAASAIGSAVYITGSDHYMRNLYLATPYANDAVFLENATGIVIEHSFVGGLRSAGSGLIQAAFVIQAGCEDITLRSISAVAAAVGAAGSSAQVVVRIDNPTENLVIEDVDAALMHAILTTSSTLAGTVQGVTVRNVRCRDMTSADLGGAAGPAGHQPSGHVVFFSDAGGAAFLDVLIDNVEADDGAETIQTLLTLLEGGTGLSATRWTVTNANVHSDDPCINVTGSTILTDFQVAQSVLEDGSSGAAVFMSLTVSGQNISITDVTAVGAPLLALLATGAAVVIQNIRVTGCSARAVTSVDFITIEAASSATVQRVAVTGCTYNGTMSFVTLVASAGGDTVDQVAVSACALESSTTGNLFDETGAGTIAGWVMSTIYHLTGGGSLVSASWTAGTDTFAS